jgi:hypothetical protein
MVYLTRKQSIGRLRSLAQDLEVVNTAPDMRIEEGEPRLVIIMTSAAE